MLQITNEKFNSFIENNTEPSWLTEYRKNCFEKYQNSDMPSFRHGTNISLRPNEEKLNVSPKNKIDTKLSSNQNLCSDIKIFGGINEIVENEVRRLKMFFGNEWLDNEDKNKIFYFNEAFTNNFLVIKIPINVEIKDPVKINYEINDATEILKVLVIAEENSKSKIILNRSGSNSYISEDIRIISEKGAKIDFITSQNFDNNVITFQKRKALLEDDSEVVWTDLCFGSQYTKSSIYSVLKGRGAKTNNRVLYLATKDQKFDIYTASIHSNENTYSDIVTKGIVNDKAKALSRGLVRIESNAANSNGYEKQDALLLSEDAEADAIPNLEIHNHDVKCSHGSTVGQIDSDKLFYLMSRGLNEKQAKQKIIEGYFAPTLEIINDVALTEKINENIANSLNQKLNILEKVNAINALKEVQDPELHMDIYSLGLIYDINIKDNNYIDIKMTLTSPTCPFGPAIMKEAKESLIKEGFKDPEINLVFTPKWEPSEDVKLQLGVA